MTYNFTEFAAKVKQSENAPLLDSLIEHAKKSDQNLDFHEATKIIKKEILERLK